MKITTETQHNNAATLTVLGSTQQVSTIHNFVTNIMFQQPTPPKVELATITSEDKMAEFVKTFMDEVRARHCESGEIFCIKMLRTLTGWDLMTAKKFWEQHNL